MQAHTRSARIARQAFKPAQARSTRQRIAVLARAENVLLVNTSKGGHAFIGLYLAQQLKDRGHSVTLFNDGDESIEEKDPFAQYEGLVKDGVDIHYGDPTDPSSYPEGDFTVVYDNNGKSMEECQPLIDTFAPKVKQYCFVGSAGAYEHDSAEPMHLERDPRKPKAGHKQVEDYLEEVDAPYTVFHPLYMYGAHTAKDCEQWYIDRIIRDRPVPIPEPGVQLTSISHVEDVAAMMADAAGNNNAIGQHFNASTDRAITIDGIAHIVADALGKKADIMHYNEKDVDIPKGKGFPFRTVHFFASTDKAKALLGWAPKHDFRDDIKEQIDLYKEAGRESEDVDFSADDMVLQ